MLALLKVRAAGTVEEPERPSGWRRQLSVED